MLVGSQNQQFYLFQFQLVRLKWVGLVTVRNYDNQFQFQLVRLKSQGTYKDFELIN